MNNLPYKEPCKPSKDKVSNFRIGLCGFMGEIFKYTVQNYVMVRTDTLYCTVQYTVYSGELPHTL